MCEEGVGGLKNFRFKLIHEHFGDDRTQWGSDGDTNVREEGKVRVTELLNVE